MAVPQRCLGSTRWSSGGEYKGNHTKFLPELAVGYKIGDAGYWYLGHKTQSFQGTLGNLGIWNTFLPEASVRALSRGVNGLSTCCSVLQWESIVRELKITAFTKKSGAVKSITVPSGLF